MTSTQKQTLISTLILIGLCFLILGISSIVNATDVVSLYGDKDGFVSDPADPPNTDIWMYGEKYWYHTYDISSLGTIKSASLEVFANGVGMTGSAAPIFLNGKFLGN